MNELDEIREELDRLRVRITSLEFDKGVTDRIAGDAITAARAADRQLARSRSEWSKVVEGLEAGMRQVISLLTSDTAAPARRPENTQSASDRPLT